MRKSSLPEATYRQGLYLLIHVDIAGLFGTYC